MITADVIAIILTLVFFIGGVLLGFGKTLKLLTDGVVGKIISVVVCYFLFGIVLALPFVQDLLNRLVDALRENGNFICRIFFFYVTQPIPLPIFMLAIYI